MSAHGLAERAGLLAALARTDVAGADVRAAFESAEIESVLLKGRAFARRLYDEVWERPYADTDLIVTLAQRDAAEAILTRLGYRRVDRDGDRLGEAGYAHTWMRSQSEFVDLHWNVSGASADAALVWETIASHTSTLSVGGRDARVPDDPLTALLVVLHAAHHGGHHGATTADLERAVERLDFASWRVASELATRVEAREAFAAGLALTATGRALASRLRLTAAASVEYRLRADEADFRVWALHRLAGARGWTRVRVAAEVIAPPPHLMRRFAPLARRGRRGLLAAYLIRPVQLAVRLAPGVRDYARARRAD